MLKHIERLTHRQMRDWLGIHFEVRAPVLIWGRTGIGKSEMIEAFGEATKMPTVTMQIGNYTPEELAGPQVFEPGQQRQRQLQPWWWPNVPSIIFLDEIGAALEETRAQALQFTLRQRLGQHVLPEGSWVVGATNTNSDGSFHNELGTPTIARFGHAELGVDPEEWVEHARERGVREDICQFIRVYPRELVSHTEDEYMVEPCPRSWVQLSKLMDEIERREPDGVADLNAISTRATAAGQIGSPTAEQYLRFVEQSRSSRLVLECWEASAKGHKAVSKVINSNELEVNMASVGAVMAGLPTRAFSNSEKLVTNSGRAIAIMRSFAEFEIQTEGRVPCLELAISAMNAISKRVAEVSKEEGEALRMSEDMERLGTIMFVKGRPVAEREETMRRVENLIRKAR